MADASDELAVAKKQIRETCRAFDDAGNDFERLTGQLLRELGFFNVRRQLSGQQFGRDYTAELEDLEGGEPTRWFFECKNLQRSIGAGHAAPKLIWHLSNQRLTGGFVIVGPSRISNELNALLEHTDFPFSVFDWTDDNFAKLVGVCPIARRQWFPSVTFTMTERQMALWRTQLLQPASSGYEMASPLRLRLSPQFSPPFEYAYFFRDGCFEKWPSDLGFLHHLSLFNACRWPLIVRSIRVRTIHYQPLPARILVQLKPKGLVPPLRLKYSPVPNGGRDIELLGSNTLQLNYRETDTVLLELVQPTRPGCYELGVTVTYDGNGRTWSVEAPPLRVCVCSDLLDTASHPGTHLRLQVWRKHYDHLARHVLALEPSQWERINSAHKKGTILWLGPTVFDDLHNRPTHWKIQLVPLKETQQDDGTSLVEFGDDDPDVLYDLGDIPAETRANDADAEVKRLSQLYSVPIGELFGPKPSDGGGR